MKTKLGPYQFERIEIAGGIGCGKSTIAQKLGTRNELQLVCESHAENPFWRLFMEEPGRYQTEKDIAFLVQHVAKIKQAGASASIVCDYALIQDLAYSKLHRKNSHSQMMSSLYLYLKEEIQPLSLLIYVHCSLETQLARIKLRGRSPEQKLSSDYLEKLNHSIEESVYGEFSESPVLSVNTETLETKEHINFSNIERSAHSTRIAGSVAEILSS